MCRSRGTKQAYKLTSHDNILEASDRAMLETPATYQTVKLSTIWPG